jgi:Xaa-Pro aminopeptidase
MRRLSLVLLALAALVPAAAQTPPAMREAAAARRARLLQKITDGILIVQSADRSQPNLYEFMVPDTESHDFIYLTGLERPREPGSILVLNPKGKTYREILYTADEVEQVKKRTGMAHVFPYARFLQDLSSAITDYRNLRITQLRFKPVASEISLGLGVEGKRKVIYFNYPRFTNLGEPANPRFELAARLRDASPEIEMRDAAEILDFERMIHDEYGQAQLRQAIRITGHGLIEGMKAARAGLTTKEVMEVIDFVYRYNGAKLGFPTGVSSGPSGLPIYATARDEHEARAGSFPIRSGELVHIDTGAEFNHYSADIQRNVPADGRFTDEQKRIYTVVADVQKAVIAEVRPGALWRDLHDLAVKMLADAGGWDKSYTYGIGHFIGMEVHDHGDYVGPLQPGMVIAIEQGAIVNGTRVAFEDDVLVTANGHEWLSRFIPFEIAEVEKLRLEPPTFDPAKVLLPPVREAAPTNFYRPVRESAGPRPPPPGPGFAASRGGGPGGIRAYPGPLRRNRRASGRPEARRRAALEAAGGRKQLDIQLTGR